MGQIYHACGMGVETGFGGNEMVGGTETAALGDQPGGEVREPGGVTDVVPVRGPPDGVVGEEVGSIRPGGEDARGPGRGGSGRRSVPDCMRELTRDPAGEGREGGEGRGRVHGGGVLVTEKFE